MNFSKESSGDVAQRKTHQSSKLDVAGSSPVIPAKRKMHPQER